MAWIDDRIWCHPKVSDLTDGAFRAFVHSIAYSAGFNCHGHLTPGQQRTIGATTKARNELIRVGLWNLNGDGSSIYIHDWDDHNSKRDARRAADRIRKKEARMSAGTSAGQSTGASAPKQPDKAADTVRKRGGQTGGPARVDGSEGSEGSDQDQKPSSLPLDADEAGRLEHLESLAQPEDISTW